MTNGNDPKKTPPPPPPPPPNGHTKPGGIKPDNTTVQPPQFRMAVVSGIGGFLGGLIGALVACCYCLSHHT